MEWNYSRNGEERLKDQTAGSKKKVWWKCKKGHEWQARITLRAQGSGCPYCAGRLVCEDNSLKTLIPAVAAEWDHERNDEPGPGSVRPGSSRRVFWKCQKGHSFVMRVLDRKHGKGCPFCSGRKAGYGRNLAEMHPALAREWHPTRNGKVKPSDVTPGSGLMVWWKCPRGHVWQATVNNRHQGHGCMRCFRGRMGKGKRISLKTRDAPSHFPS